MRTPLMERYFNPIEELLVLDARAVRPLLQASSAAGGWQAASASQHLRYRLQGSGTLESEPALELAGFAQASAFVGEKAFILNWRVDYADAATLGLMAHHRPNQQLGLALLGKAGALLVQVPVQLAVSSAASADNTESQALNLRFTWRYPLLPRLTERPADSILDSLTTYPL